jgi:hypothetical protein
MAEHYMQPLSSLKEPKTLSLKQFARDMTLDSLVTLFWICCIVCPIVFAIAWRNSAHLLQLAYLPLAFIIAPIVFNFSPVGLRLSNVVHFMPVLILLMPVALICRLVPVPSWYIGVVPLQLIFFWYTQRRLPRLKQKEWKEFSRNTGMSREEIEEALRAKPD